mmetsp:Transcript_30547/g.71267  ORF Transcript_30547/g.71267 Transcript_30547/m.71267 type:complete len:204 (-) Transcript_30547:836-1447(-)
MINRPTLSLSLSHTTYFHTPPRAHSALRRRSIALRYLSSKRPSHLSTSVLAPDARHSPRRPPYRLFVAPDARLTGSYGFFQASHGDVPAEHAEEGGVVVRHEGGARAVAAPKPRSVPARERVLARSVGEELRLHHNLFPEHARAPVAPVGVLGEERRLVAREDLREEVRVLLLLLRGDDRGQRLQEALRRRERGVGGRGSLHL